jgi:hypothetical protein
MEQWRKKAPLKRIIDRQYFRDRSCAKAADGSVELILECGHSEWRKCSQEPMNEARCQDCYNKMGRG